MVLEGSDLESFYQPYKSGEYFLNIEELHQNQQKGRKQISEDGTERWEFPQNRSSRAGIVLGTLFAVPVLSDNQSNVVYEVKNKRIVRLTIENSHTHWNGGVLGCIVVGAHSGISPLCGDMTRFIVTSGWGDLGLQGNSGSDTYLIHHVNFFEHDEAKAIINKHVKSGGLTDRSYYLNSALAVGNVTIARYLLASGMEIKDASLHALAKSGDIQLITQFLQIAEEKPILLAKHV